MSKRQTVFFLLVDPMYKEHKDLDTIDLEAPRLAQYLHKARKKHHNTVYWVDINLAQRKGLKFLRHDPTLSFHPRFSREGQNLIFEDEMNHEKLVVCRDANHERLMSGRLKNRSDFNEELSTLHHLHQVSGERQLRPVPFWKYQYWQQSSGGAHNNWAHSDSNDSPHMSDVKAT